MNTVKAKKTPMSGLKRIIALTALAVFILTATGCGRGGGGKVCSAYGGKQPAANQVQSLD